MIGVQERRSIANTGCTDHQAMHIVTIDQRVELFAALDTAKNQSLHCRASSFRHAMMQRQRES